MQVVAFNRPATSSRRMPSTMSPKQAEQQLTGQALRNLRERADMTQAEVGLGVGLTGAGWQYYEAGARRFTHEKIAAALRVIGCDEHELDAERARILGAPSAPQSGMAEARSEFIFDIYGRAHTGEQGPMTYDVGSVVRRLDLRQLLGRSVDVLEIAGDALRPWGESGELAFFDRSRAPKRHRGCVVELKSGEGHVKLYDKQDGSTLFVTEIYPTEKTVTFRLSDVKGVYPVILRGD